MLEDAIFLALLKKTSINETPNKRNILHINVVKFSEGEFFENFSKNEKIIASPPPFPQTPTPNRATTKKKKAKVDNLIKNDLISSIPMEIALSCCNVFIFYFLLNASKLFPIWKLIYMLCWIIYPH